MCCGTDCCVTLLPETEKGQLLDELYVLSSYLHRFTDTRPSLHQVTDMMLQDSLYPDWGQTARRFWKKGNNRIVLFWWAAGWNSCSDVGFVEEKGTRQPCQINRGRLMRCLCCSLISPVRKCFTQQDYRGCFICLLVCVFGCAFV